ncbi:type VI secretion system baseplate subunit TssK [Niveispirillum sp. BGYR6]|uniref:type VI secretion system baseplate subunit TssK n=1 Tax=Niveispirillum sp. BGYR6 TaxID=2971249 RepID=UPI0022B9AE97|nr:type VI secretion system baseplate subunit TssK [Niveispirillum sp. BGYR6]MDG5493795.1 type VI secretion system baseplate subunit TssK [Niveispirillum sp. BGYR6]
MAGENGKIIAAPPVPDPVQWHEGMLLQPHHFQQSWLRQDALLQFHLSRIAPFAHGVVRMELDRGALSAGRLRLLAVEAVLPDGLLIRHDGADDRLEMDLPPLKDRLSSPQRVHLVLPKYQPGSARPDDDLARWRSRPGESAVDENTGSHAEPIPRLRPALRLRLEDDLPPGMVSLPLLEIEFKNQTFQLTDYEAPSAVLSPTSALFREGRALVAKLREKASYVAEAQGGELDRAEARQTVLCLVAGLPLLEGLLGLPALHPLELYKALLNVMGHVSILRSSLVPPLTEPYDHLDPRGCIGRLLAAVDLVLDHVAQAFAAMTFEPVQHGFRHRIEESWLTGELIVGLRLKPGQKADDAADWMEAALIATEKRLDELGVYRLRGASRRALSAEEASAFAASRDVMLYAVACDDFVAAGEPLFIVNPLDRAGLRRPADILLFIPNGPGT